MNNGISNSKRRCQSALAGLLLGLVLQPARAHAQGVLTVTPGRTASTASGTGSVGYTGDGAAAAAAALATPAAVAYDSAGNLFLADRDNHVIREVVKTSGSIITVAGSGTPGFSGDGGLATSAQLDTPTGIAVDGSGALYIADSHNHRIRKVSGGTISTIAGTGTAGYIGDGAAAVSAQLSSPQGVAVDSTGTVYIADTNNQRIRRVSGGTITTIAGTGEQGYAGDGAAATSAEIDSPTAVAVDTAGTVYIADRHNQRIRSISAAGLITTVAGAGTPNFSGGYAGDGGRATAALLSRPSGVAVDGAGNIYIADTDNHRVRTVTAGGIATLAGSGAQDFSGDGSVLTAAALDQPKSIALDAAGNLSIADAGNDRVRSAASPTLLFDLSGVGVASSVKTVTLSNIGTAALTVSAVSLNGPFSLVATGTCSAAPITLAAGTSCTEDLAFTPTQPGAATGSFTVTGPGAAPAIVLLTGSAVAGTTTVTLSSNVAFPFVNQTVTLTATVKPSSQGQPTGTVTFYSAGVQLGAVQTLTNGVATLTTNFATAGTYSITAVYSGDSNFGGSSSAVLSQLVGDFSFSITQDPSQPSNVTVVPGKDAVFQFSAAAVNGPFTFPITLSATGLPPGATVTFTPSTLQLGNSAVPFTMTVHTSAAAVRLERIGGGGAVLALLLLPFASRARRRSRTLRPLTVLAFGLLSLGTLAGLTGCGANSGFFGSPQRTYSINVIGTAQNAQGTTLQRVATVTLTIQ